MSEPEAEGFGTPAKAPRGGLVSRLRTYFFAGMLVTAPAFITFYMAYLIVTFIDDQVTRFIPAKYNPETYLPFGLPGLGVVLLVVVLILVGALTAGFVGRALVRVGERLLARMPVIRNVYGALKQIFETVLAQQSTAFRQVVMVEYPRRGVWSIGFLTGASKGEVQYRTEDDVINVFIPTTPNPTSGYLLFVPREDLVMMDMSVEEGIKLVISGGIVVPPFQPKDAPALPPEP